MPDSAPIALVTGSSRGIGAAAARALAADGFHVIAHGRTPSAELDSTVAELGEHASAVTFDVGSPDELRAGFKAIFERHRRLDVLVANAGILDDSLVGMITDDQIDRTLAVNVAGTIGCVQSAARLMRRAGGGSIVLVSSIIGTNGNAGQVVYGASKAAVLGIMRSAAKELAPQQIRVNAVAPGYIDTRMIAHLPPEVHEARMASIGMRRIGTADDVARVIAFLASPAAAYVTGQVIGVDGGMLL